MGKRTKSIFKRIVVMLIAFAMTFTSIPSAWTTALAATGNGEIAFKSADYRIMTVGQSYDFNLLNTIQGSKYVWKSNKPSVATVNKKGIVKAVAAGNATITCTVTTNGKKTVLKAAVYVKKASKNPATGITITNKIASMAIGEKYDLNRSLSPKTASDFVNWISSNTAVASVDKNGIVTAKAKGNVVIKATALNGEVSDKVVIKISDKKYVATQTDLTKALKSDSVSTVVIKTNAAVSLKIPAGDYANKKLIAYAPKGTVYNRGQFASVEIRAIANDSWYEYANNLIKLTGAKGHLVIASGSNAEVTVAGANSKWNIEIMGDAKVTVAKTADVTFTGDTNKVPDVTVVAKDVSLHTELALNLNASEKATLELKSSTAAKTEVTADNKDVIPAVSGEGQITVTVGDEKYTTDAQGTLTPADTTVTPTVTPVVVIPGGTPGSSVTPGGSTDTPTTAPTTAPTPSVPAVNEKGLDAEGRMVAVFGAPIVDGKVDDVWNNAVSVPVSSSKTPATVTFKTMWDDNALYILAQVKDPEMSVAASNPYEQDSLEIFMDENNDKTQGFGTDDLQFRVNYENKTTADKGDLARFYTQTSKVDGGYIIEARIEFQKAPANDQVVGLDLQINDGTDTGRKATLNVFDQTGGAWNNTALFGNMVLTGKTNSAPASVNPYKLLSLIGSLDRLNKTDYTNWDTVTAAVTAAEAVLSKTGVTQAEIDEQYKALDATIKGLNYTEEAKKVKRYTPLPETYRGVNANAGTISRMTYDVKVNGKTVTKPVNVYLPYGYDKDDKAKKYNVLYLMHGGGENIDTIFGAAAGESAELKRILDNMIANGDIDPLIVVTPTFNDGYNEAEKFYNEVPSMIPAIEMNLNTYLTTGDAADVEATREHRAFGGFSMGSLCTWNVFVNCFDDFKYFLPFSGECRFFAETDEVKNAEDKPLAISKKLAEVVEKSSHKDFYILSATGSDDIAYPNLNPQMEAMKKVDTFKFNADLTVGNTYFIVADGGTHAWNFVNQYIYDILPDLFGGKAKAEPDNKLVATFGTPKIDGDIDAVWDKATTITPELVSSPNVKATGTFKLLWDDKALYVLAQVQDPNMSVAPSDAYQQDSIELFLDENNDKTTAYGADDLHFRVNYNNVQSIDQGDGTRFYTATKVVDGGYQVEARIELTKVPENGSIEGIELQINDAIGTSRVGTVNVFDNEGNAWQNTKLFGEVKFTGKEAGAVSGADPYKLMGLVEQASKIAAPAEAVAFNNALTAAQNILNDDQATQDQVDAAYAALKDVTDFVNAYNKAASMDLSVYKNGADVTTALDAAKVVLAKADATKEEMTTAANAINTAVDGLIAGGLDDEGRLVAMFGTPEVDGDIDDVWNKVPQYVPALPSGGSSTDTTAKFKVLWDDNALYVLADVTDNSLDVTSGTVYNRDCIELMLDEGNNAVEKIFDLDDDHYRISCENSHSADRGNLERLYSAVKKTDTGYVLEARIALQKVQPVGNGTIYGMELQVNDAKGGNRTGTLNVFDKTSTTYLSPTLFGTVVLAGKQASDVSGFNKYDFANLVDIAKEIQLARYTTGSAATLQGLLDMADETVATKDQEQVDALYEKIETAIRELVHRPFSEIPEEIAKEKEFRHVPSEYRAADKPEDVYPKGTIERVKYPTFFYNSDDSKGEEIEKDMLVYLPAGYNAADPLTKYNVLYLIHGTAEDQNTVFGDAGQTTELKKILDMMIANGDMEPMIVITPTWNGCGSVPFHNEMANDILPFVATNYNTYAASGSAEDLIASRDHRAIGGFSQGSMCIWNIMEKHANLFKYYMPLSFGTSGKDWNTIFAGYKQTDYYVFAATGTDDIAESSMVDSIPAMDESDMFTYNADLSKGNVYFINYPGGTHTWQWINQYLYNMLPDLFFHENVKQGIRF